MSKRSLLVPLFALGLVVSPAFVWGQDPALKVDGSSDGSLLSKFEETDGAFLESVEAQKKLLEETIKADIRNRLDKARTSVALDPEGTIRDLKEALEGLAQVPELDPAVRAQLRTQVEGAIRSSERKAFEFAETRSFIEERNAAANEARLLVAEVARNSQKAKQLMDRFNSLMEERRYIEAEVDIAAQVGELTPGQPIGLSAGWRARLSRQVEVLEEVRLMRHRNFADSLLQNEKSLVPFVDEPPIVYPTAEVWEDLTRRRAKYKSMDLGGDNERERRIFQALDDDTTIEFLETPLS